MISENCFKCLMEVSERVLIKVASLCLGILPSGRSCYLIFLVNWFIKLKHRSNRQVIRLAKHIGLLKDVEELKNTLYHSSSRIFTTDWRQVSQIFDVSRNGIIVFDTNTIYCINQSGRPKENLETYM